jgi:two-component system cell cycle sensor histidine kinase/response regulator CckA
MEDNVADKHHNSQAFLEFLEKSKAELIARIQTAFVSLAFENRFTMHPRRLKELGAEEYEQFLVYLESGDVAQGVSQGRKRAEEGLGQHLVMEFGGLLRSFLLTHSEGELPRHLPLALNSVDAYINAYLNGYIEIREKKILEDQEQLRVALSTALERHRRELFIKNHAIHTSINGIMLADLEGRITYVNPAFLDMWKIEDEAGVVGTSCSAFMGNINNEDIIIILMEQGGWQGEIVSRRLDDSAFDLSVSASIIRDENSQPVGIMAFFIDVTERHRLETQFRQAQKMEALGQLAGGIVHDFNNLLTAISGYAQLELMDLPQESPAYQDFLQIKTATDRGKDLTQELRIFTRQASSDRESLNLNSVLEETYKILKRTFPPEVKIEINAEPELQSIKANPSQMSQMLMNLCVNARDAIMTKNDGSLSEGRQTGGLLELSTTNVEMNSRLASRFLNVRPGKYICLSIRDSGTGISSQVMDRLFEPFFTTKGERRGTGLGLAVVYGIVQNHDGFIDVTSKPGEGSTFLIYLPVFKNHQGQPAPKPYTPDLTAGRGTVLVAEDEPQVREMVIRALEKSGYSVLSAEDGREAVSLFEKYGRDIDLVVLDMVMPHMGGQECYQQLKAMNPEVQIMIMTGYTSDTSAENFFREGNIQVIKKPFELQSFTKSVRQAIAMVKRNSAGS